MKFWFYVVGDTRNAYAKFVRSGVKWNFRITERAKITPQPQANETVILWYMSSLVPRPSSLCLQKKIREKKAWYNLSRDWRHRLWSISLAWALFDLHPHILNMQTCLPASSTTPKLPASTAGKGCSKGTSAGAGLCQKLHACLPPCFTVSCRGCGCWVRPRSIKSCLPPVYLWHHSRDNLYQAFLSLIIFWVRGRGRPGDEASICLAFSG